MIPAQREPLLLPDQTQPVEVVVTITVALKIEAQRAELHLDLTDTALAELAVHSGRTDEPQ